MEYLTLEHLASLATIILGVATSVLGPKLNKYMKLYKEMKAKMEDKYKELEKAVDDLAEMTKDGKIDKNELKAVIKKIKGE